MNKILGILVIFVFLAQSCTTSADKKEINNEPSLEKINELEEEIFGTKEGVPDMRKAHDLLNLYVAYVDAYPKDSVAPDLLFKASDISMNIASPTRTISLFNRLLQQYPDYKNIPTIMFLKGFVYEDQMQDYTNARKSYMDFLDKYPNSEFADDAIISLKNLGKTPEELIKEFESN